MQNLLSAWGKLKVDLKGKSIYLFLDYDGTLTSIVDTPAEAVLSTGMKNVLDSLSKLADIKIAIISGRALVEVKNRVGLNNIIYVGNHGVEIEGPKIKFSSPYSPRCRKIIENIKNDLSSKLFAIKGVLLEDKGYYLALHYRLVDREFVPELKRIFRESINIFLVRNKIKVRIGKEVIEVGLPLSWDKGKVVLWLLARQKFVSKDKSIVPVYLGDDKTDEDAFNALKKKGITAHVGKNNDSNADYYLDGPSEVKRFLQELLKL